ncbi:OLC1v1029371C1 [Oldenlandia corymbosa var. corymbosa]|uniref:OLC1v1029371C1 n=1 Tax=Oldenlandia corymbosa var. corymbosa TaxID=529605 RepID=A0AAV1CGP7_OLDCO|nr:OLC1v1029371C1 [Oldenlandia corymbosa var. corymbosa]
MAPSLLLRLPTTTTTASIFHRSNYIKPKKISTQISCIGWDPEGVLGPPRGGHIARLEFKKRLEKDAGAREAFERQVRQEKERRRALRDSRGVPNTPAELVEYFLNTEAQEIEFEIARLRPKLNDEFFAHIKLELGKIKFAVTRTQDMEDRLAELELLEKALQEGTEAYDKMQAELVTAKKSLAKILTSQDIKKTLLEMVELNELNRSLLTLLDENIAGAQRANQEAFEKRTAITKELLDYENFTVNFNNLE